MKPFFDLEQMPSSVGPGVQSLSQQVQAIEIQTDQILSCFDSTTPVQPSPDYSGSASSVRGAVSTLSGILGTLC